MLGEYTYMMSRISTKYLAREVYEFALAVRQPVPSPPPEVQPRLTRPVAKAFRDAYSRGGLSEVDVLIDSINDELHADGATCGLANGCACEHGNGGEPDALCIRFIDYGARNPYYFHWLILN